MVILDDGREIQTRSLLEASWIQQLQHHGLVCYECRPLPCTRVGKYGVFLGTYTPDLLLVDFSGQEIMVELKPNKQQAKKDLRPGRSINVDPSLIFLVIGGYPDNEKGFYLKMITDRGEKEHFGVPLDDLIRLLHG